MRLVGARLLRAFFNLEQTLLDVMIEHRFTKVALLMYYPNRNMWRARGFRDSVAESCRWLKLAQRARANFYLFLYEEKEKRKMKIK